MSTTGPADSAGISPEDFEGGAQRTGRLAAFVCIVWSLFQLWVASDFPFYLSEVTGLKLVFNNQEARQIHLAFGLGLALSLYPAVRSVHPLLDRLVGWGLATLGVAACLYLFMFKLDIANRAGLPNRYDLFFSIAGMLCVMVAVYRALGLPLLIVAMIFIIYVMFGHLDFFPDAMRWKGASLNKATWHFWMQTEGVFGVALGNANLPSIEELRRFKENITVALVSVLFIVLTADLDPALLRALDWHGALLIAMVIFVLRPLAVAVATLGTDLSWQERVLVGWIAPRGIVAAAVAGAFSARMLEAGYADADRLLPLVFLLIVTTVVLHGFSLPWVARHLGLASKRADGLVLVGASPWSIDLAVRLKELDIPVLVVDASWHRLRPARLAGLPIHFGQVISESADRNLDLSSIGYVMAATDNDAYNALVCTRFSNEFNRSSVFQLPMPGTDDDDRTGLTPTLRGQRVFSGDALYETLLQRYFEGWRFQKTRLSEEYDFDKYCARIDAELFATLVVKAGGGLVLDVTRYEPVAGDVIVNFLPPAS